MISASILLRISLALRNLVELFGKWGSFLVIPLILITVWDVTARKLIWIQLFMVEHASDWFK